MIALLLALILGALVFPGFFRAIGKGISMIIAAGVLYLAVIGLPHKEANASKAQDAVVASQDQDEPKTTQKDVEAALNPPGGGTAFDLPIEPSQTLKQVDEAETYNRGLSEFKDALQDPRKVALMECMGVKIYEDPQPIGHPPSQGECRDLMQH